MTIIRSPQLRKLLGITQFEELWKAWHHETDKSLETPLSSIAVLFAFIVALLPAAAYFSLPYVSNLDSITVAVGIATCLAFLFRFNSGLCMKSSHNWKREMYLTHTAFAVGCIPLVLILIFYPEAFQVIAEHGERVRGSGAQKPSLMEIALFIFLVSVWAGITEEFIYRGMLISCIRRWNAFGSQRKRDIFAILISSLVFGLSHLATWGPGMSVVLIGLGIGFGIAYIAIGESLLPLIVYHIVFDVLSLSISLFVK